jgi:hypothetical protein
MQRQVLRYSGVGKVVLTVGVDQVPFFETGDKTDCSNFEDVYRIFSNIKRTEFNTHPGFGDLLKGKMLGNNIPTRDNDIVHCYP